MQVDPVTVDFRRQAVEPLRERGIAGFGGATTDCASAPAGDPKRLMLSNSKARSAHGHVDRHELRILSGFFARLVAQRESFLTRLGTHHVCRTRLYDQGARMLAIRGSSAGDSIQAASIVGMAPSRTSATRRTVTHAAPNATETSTAPLA